ncbi:MAG: type II secretion system minor pseudopilin GspK [Pseudomonadota bacterium]|nr:type II secretion system minor pseudopilin GspK [Pseudomonadota bacterium]
MNPIAPRRASRAASRVMHLQRQRGVAVITALLLTTLAVTIVASLFWQQQVQVRSIENQRTQLQKQWILRGAIDWARLILRSSGSQSQTDTLSDPWAIPLQEVRMDDFVENGKQDAEASSAVLSGNIVDAHALFNLSNLTRGGQPSPPDVAAFARLLTNLQVPAATTLAQATADYLLSARAPAPAPAAAAGTNADAGGASQIVAPTPRKGGPATPSGIASAGGGAQVMTLTQVNDLLAVDGFTLDTVNKLRDYVTVIGAGKDTNINVNTASAVVLSAVIPGLSTSDAATVVAGRERSSFKDIADFQSHLPASVTAPNSTTGAAPPLSGLDVKSEHFLVNGKVKLNNAVLEIQSLVERPTHGGPVKTVWTREN